MCGRYVPPDVADLERLWHIGRHNSTSILIRHFNVAPTAQVPIVVLEPDGETVLTDARWGLVPFWWKKETLPPLTFNARSEEAAEKPMWRNSLRNQRCLMPAAGWYEWNEQQKVRGPSGKLTNQPYYHYSPDSEVLAIAGLWAHWQGLESQMLQSCALLTKEAAPTVAAIHHRMPVILKPEYFAAWLDPKTPAQDVQHMIADARQDFEFFAVNVRVNNARNEGPELLEPLSAPGALLET